MGAVKVNPRATHPPKNACVIVDGLKTWLEHFRTTEAFGAGGNVDDAPVLELVGLGQETTLPRSGREGTRSLRIGETVDDTEPQFCFQSC